jgi:16S rRNA (guanine966-N2)-methyltransferase
MTRVRKVSKTKMGSIRIIGGEHRGRKLPVLDLDGLRPTTDRMKETLFNWLMMDVRGAICLDCFAGAGSLGFEALSRGAKQLVFIELNKAAANQIRSNAALLKYESDKTLVEHGDALKVIPSLNTAADIIFIDPPFNNNLVQATVDIIAKSDMAQADTLIYIEHEAALNSLLLPDNWQIHKEKLTQQVSARVFRVG